MCLEFGDAPCACCFDYGPIVTQSNHVYLYDEFLKWPATLMLNLERENWRQIKEWSRAVHITTKDLLDYDHSRTPECRSIQVWESWLEICKILSTTQTGHKTRKKKKKIREVPTVIQKFTRWSFPNLTESMLDVIQITWVSNYSLVIIF